MKLPRLTAKEAEDIIKKKGFVLIRQSGSHRIYRNAKGVRVTIPFHGKKILHPRIVKSIFSDAEISQEDLG